MMRARRLATVALASAILAGAGAPARVVAQGVGGHEAKEAVQGVTSPEQQKRVDQMVDRASAKATKSAFDAATKRKEGGSPLERAAKQVAAALERKLVDNLREDLGEHGEGPLGRSLSATVGRMSSEATANAVERLLPDCADSSDKRCLDHRVAQLSHSAAVGFVRGMKDTLGWVALVLAFVLGLLLALIGFLLWSLHRTRRDIDRATRARLSVPVAAPEGQRP
jgi:hypothetical protein